MSSATDPPIIQPPVELKPLPPELHPSIDHFVTEDGAPVDNVFSEKQMRLLTESLYASWEVERPFVAFANVGLFYGSHLPPVVPDVLLSLDVRLPENLFPKINRSYFVWAYGKPPEVVVEIVSNREGKEDTEKMDIYANVRVSHYFIFDPEHHLSDQTLRGFQLSGSQYVPMSDPSALIGSVGLSLVPWNGRYEDTDGQWVRWVDADGTMLATGRESAEIQKRLAQEEATRAETEAQRAETESQRAETESQRAKTESQRAETEAQRAETESQRAETESQRAEAAAKRADEADAEKERLVRLLKQHGIDPESTEP